jgi:putative cell wall-binding protein
MRKARKSLAILLAVAMVFCMAPAMVFGAGDDGQVNRIAGNDRYITSAETALRAFESADTVLIARGDDEGGFADGLAASYLAGVENAPILLTEPNGLPPVVKDAISKLGAKKAIILGGPAVVSDKVKDDLAGLEVERIFGDDRFETAAKIAAKGKADTAFVVSGYAPADSLVAGPLAFSKNYPILLVGNNVPDFTSKALADLGIKNIYVIGGTGVVSESVYNDLAAKADQIVRYGGNDRVATSLEVAQNLYTNPVNFSIVGYDGLADAVGAAVFGNPILYTDSDLGISGIQSYLAGAVTADSNVNIFGGTGVVSNAAETALENIVPDELKVEIVSAINANQISVKFEGVEEAVTIDLEVALVDGDNEVTFQYEGQTFTATVTYEAPDTEAPVLVYDGETTINLENGAEFTIPVVTATDNKDENVEVNYVIKDADGNVLEAIDTYVAGTYTITYSAVDATGNAAESLVITVNVEEAALKVTEISAITKTYVDVTFEAVADAMEDVTIEVIDNNGDVVEVKPVNLVKGETVATFTFTKALTEDPEGVWTIAGVKVDLDLAANLKAVYEAADQVKLLEGLNKLGLTDVKGENIAFYEAELAKITDSSKDTYVELEKFTKEVAQKVVTDGNAEALKAVDEEAIVKAVNEAKTQVALLEALAPFERVNADWIADYEGVLGTAETSIKGIQTKIDGANALRVNPKVTALDLDNQAAGASIVKKDLNEAKVLVTNYQKPDGEGETTKAEILRKIDRQLAIVAVLEAETPAQLTVAINALKAVDVAFELDMTAYKDANRDAYIAHFKTLTPATQLNTIALIDQEIKVVNTAQANKPIANINAADTADKLLAALKAYSEVKYVADDNKAVYFSYLSGKTAGGTTTGYQSTGFAAAATKAEVQELIDAANIEAIVTAATAADNNVTLSKTDDLYKALVNYGQLKDVNVANKTSYAATAIADAIKAIPFGNQSEVAAAKALLQAEVDKANVAAVVAASANAEQRLAKLNLISELKNVKAENAAAYLKDAETTKISAATDVTTLQAAIDAINTAEAATVGVKAVNNATTATELRDILTELVVDGDITANDYLNLTNADKLLVAELFMDDDAFTTDGLAGAVRTNLDANKEYQALADIGTDLNTLAGNFDALRSDMNTVFAGATPATPPTIAAVQTKLANLVQANYTAYDELTGTQKLAVAEEFIKAFPVNADGDKYTAGYSTVTAYFAAVDAAIAAIQ